MDLPRDFLELIDDYVSDALDATGTRKLRQARRAPTPVPIASSIEVDIDVSDMVADASADAASDQAAPLAEHSEDLLPVEIDEGTDPAAPNLFTFDERTAWMAEPFQSPREPIPTLSRIRTARGSQPPPAEVEIDDEITNLLGSPSAPK